MKKVKWGIIGLGRIAQKFAADLKLSEHAELFAVASRSPERAREFSPKYNSHHHFSSYQELCNCDDIDVVYVATPHSFHLEHTMMCLESGKAVLCEKPMGLSASEADQMISMARAKDLFLMEAMWTRFIPAIEKALELISAGVIGEPFSIRADFGFRAKVDPYGRLFNKELGGGSLMDIGIYPVYLALLLLGKPEHIQAVSRKTDTGVDAFCAVLFDYKGGQKAVLESSIETNTPTEAFIHGTKGYIHIHRRFHQPHKISVHLNDGSAEDFAIPYTGNGYLHEIEEVNRCIANELKESSGHSLQSSADLIDVLDQIKTKIGLQYQAPE